MTKEDDRAREEFTSEAEELLDTLSRDLVEFEAQGKNVRPEVVNKIFREVHSLKGLADMLDRLRMGKIPITKDLIDLLYDSVDSLNRLVIAINDPSLAGLVDVTNLASRIHRTVTSQPQQKVEDPFSELTLDEQTKKSLTEYEEHRLLENVRAGKYILAIEQTFDFSDFDEKLRALTSVLNEAGEVISTLPALDSSGGSGIAFRLLYGSMLNEPAVAALAPDARVSSLRKDTSPAAVAAAGAAMTPPPPGGTTAA